MKRKLRKWKMWAVCHHWRPCDLFDTLEDARWFKKAWKRDGEILHGEFRELPKRRRVR